MNLLKTMYHINFRKRIWKHKEQAK
jgi:hypothetical protein